MSSSSLAKSVLITMAIAIFFSYCLQFYVPINIMGPWVKSHFRTEEQKKLAEGVFRTVLVFFTCEEIIESKEAGFLI